MTSDLQALVDNLGNRLGRSVAVDDPNINLLAYNSHASTVDDARIESIMQRHVSRDLVAHIHRSGAKQARDLFTIPAQPELGLAISRVGMPIRHETKLLGFLWLVDSDGPVTDQVDAIRQAADRAALILHREYLIGELSRGRERELMRDLIHEDSNLRGTAATQLIADELFASGPITVLVLTIAQEENEPLGERDRLALAGGLDHGRRRRPPRLALQLERANHGILLTRCDIQSSTAEIDELAAAVHTRMTVESGRSAQQCTIGIGEPRRKLSDALHSYHEARRAADLARITNVLGPITKHSELGIYGLFAELPPERLRPNLHQGLQTLLDNANGDTLVTTLEAFLDNAGNVQQTAAKLCVHRASLYYRLRRIEEIADISFSNGDDRLALHLGLKLIQVLGIR